MELWQAFLLGMMVAWTPGLIVLAYYCAKLKRRALITLGGDRVARRPYRFRRNLTSAIDEYTKKTIQTTSSTNMTPIIIRGHTRLNRRSRGIAAGLPVAVALTLGSEVVGPRLGSGG